MKTQCKKCNKFRKCSIEQFRGKQENICKECKKYLSFRNSSILSDLIGFKL